MCGINGFNFNDKNLVNLMNKRINHRGPDDSGIFLNNNLSLGQVRLSIIDLTDAGHQPMFYSKNLGASSKKYCFNNVSKSDISIVFNGEIYNYLEIKIALEKKGYKFSTNTDTEIILASYIEWGQNCVNKFNGMWAFCIYDLKKNILFCSRDRLGVKPFYYYFKDGQFIFSSELKGILEHKSLGINLKKNLNKDAVEFYFNLGFVPSPLSIFNDVFKLEASHNLVFDLNKNNIVKINKYYEMPNYSPIYNKKKLILEGKKLLADSVKIRMRSDVPVGAFLSGGLDSSSIVAKMKDFTDLSKLHTFSIGFPGKYDETPYINVVKNSLNTKHHHSYFKENDFSSLIDNFQESYDEPFWDYSGFPTLKISKMAKKNVVVSLSGDGGDEIFAGYSSHLIGSRMDFIYKMPKFLRIMGSKLPFKKNLNSTKSFYLLKEAFKISLFDKKYFYAKALDEDGIKTSLYKKWTVDKLNYSLKKSDGNLADALRVYDLLFNTLQDNFLVKVDRASMRYALEVRSPFLDYRFVEFAQKIPTSYKISIFQTKKLMRDIISDLLPKEIVYRGKQGFEPPLKEWLFKNFSNDYFINYLQLIEKLNKEIYDFYINKVFKEKNALYDNYKIRLFLFAKWYERWVR
ncbi:MAG: asparagine synthase (glutamine-hydrolyzing) [Nanoarchaeota archaeon]|nr:asparagine synthase (glutamine-hydrolyzing) [Nanoarchaeota archaeon]